jgi:hypothetical protein
MSTAESYIKLKNVNSFLGFGVIPMGRRLRVPWIYPLKQIKEEERVALLVGLVFIVTIYNPESLQDECK